LITKAGSVLILLLLIGVPELAHADITSQASRYLGWKEGTTQLNSLMGVNTSRTSWCAIFVRSMFERSGKKPPSIAGSVAGWDNNLAGTIVQTPRKGDLAFFRHSHMAIVLGISDGKICTISGNRRNKVTKSCESRNRFKRFRRPV
jgi:uncharacterized protein (TIGR02594 family)